MIKQNELPLALRSAYLALHRRSDAKLAQHGVTADQFVLLSTLSQGDSLTQRELARRMPSDPSTVRSMLVLLEKQGLVRRDPHPTDSRARTAALTVAGRRKFQQLWRASESIREELYRAIDPQECENLVQLLHQIANSLNPETATSL